MPHSPDRPHNPVPDTQLQGGPVSTLIPCSLHAQPSSLPLLQAEPHCLLLAGHVSQAVWAAGRRLAGPASLAECRLRRCTLPLVPNTLQQYPAPWAVVIPTQQSWFAGPTTLIELPDPAPKLSININTGWLCRRAILLTAPAGRAAVGLEEQLTYVDLAIRAMAARLQGVPDAHGMS